MFNAVQLGELKASSNGLETFRPRILLIQSWVPLRRDKTRDKIASRYKQYDDVDEYNKKVYYVMVIE